MSEQIKRYDPAEVMTDRWEMGCMDEKPDGDYVRVEDHEDAIAAKDARIAELKGVLCYVRQSAIYDNTVQAERIDAVIGAKQQDEPKCKTCDGCGDVHGLDGEWRGYCDCAAGVALRGSKSATPSEDGRDDAPPCAIAYMTADKRMLIFADKADAMEWDDRADLAPLYSLEELNRIVAAKDAEIARLRIDLGNQKALTDQANYHKAQRGQVIDELRAALLKVSKDGDKLRADLNAQPARQVGGDEREAFEASGCATSLSRCTEPGFTDGYDSPSTNMAWRGWQARAALAPAAACVMPERKADKEALTDYWRDNYEAGEANGFNEALDEVARLNRRAIPVGLLERLQHYVNHCDFSEPEWNGERELLQDELRALLGKAD